MLAIIKILFSTDTSRNHSHVTRGRFPTLQAYMVRFRFEIAIIFSPPFYRDCKYIWSLPWKLLQPYKVYPYSSNKLLRNIFQDYQQAVESLLPLEKNCRVNHDAVSLSRVLVAIVEICYNKKAWKDLNENIAALTKVFTLIDNCQWPLVSPINEFF